jgi:hypothetical protein
MPMKFTHLLYVSQELQAASKFAVDLHEAKRGQEGPQGRVNSDDTPNLYGFDIIV